MKLIPTITSLLLLGFLLQCESSKPNQSEIALGKRKIVRETQNLKSKSYLPLTVVWDIEEEVHVGRETVVILSITSGDSSEDLILNLSLPPELALTRGARDVSLGNFLAGETKQVTFALIVRTSGSFQIGANLSRIEQGQRLGFAKMINLSTAEQPTRYTKPERTVTSENGDSYYILPEGQTEVIPGK